jgi:phospholipid/cholesterol/gamma-HCH transport system ATP-binding protein
MDSRGAILDLTHARSVRQSGETPPPPLFDLWLNRGDLLLIDAQDAAPAARFADLCCGLTPLAEGSVRFLGRDWAALPQDFAAALRGRIGRVFAAGGWIEFLDIADNIMLPQLHHTRLDPVVLRDKAATLACAFGLPGLPLGHAADLSPRDLARAACVRALLGDPTLLLLESPVSDRFTDLKAPLLNAIAAARSQGAAAIWLTRGELIWRDRAFPATSRWRLGAGGLLPDDRAA